MDKSTAIFFPHKRLRYQQINGLREPQALPRVLASGVKQPVNRALSDCIRFNALSAA